MEHSPQSHGTRDAIYRNACRTGGSVVALAAFGPLGGLRRPRRMQARRGEGADGRRQPWGRGFDSTSLRFALTVRIDQVLLTIVKKTKTC